MRKLHPCIRVREDSDQGRHMNIRVLPSDSRRGFNGGAFNYRLSQDEIYMNHRCLGGGGVHKRWGLEHKKVVIFTFPTSLLYGNCKGQHQEEDLFPPCMVSTYTALFIFFNVGLNSVLLGRLL